MSKTDVLAASAELGRKPKSAILGRPPAILVEVTQKRIEAGVKRNSNHCMIAEAVKDSRPELSHIAVDIQTIRATNPKKRERYVWLTPRSVQEMIINFDRGVKPRPFSFRCTEGQTTRSGARHNYDNEKKQKKMRAGRHGKTNMPERVGGKTPPHSVGQRRSFGLRSLKF